MPAPSALNNHTTKTHPEGFDSVVGLSQISLQINESLEEPMQEINNVSDLSMC